LKKEGFKKRTRTFYCKHENHIELINIQASKWNEGNGGRFTVNVGVYTEIAEVTDALLIDIDRLRHSSICSLKAFRSAALHLNKTL
jgi:hypothetical protein